MTKVYLYGHLIVRVTTGSVADLRTKVTIRTTKWNGRIFDNNKRQTFIENKEFGFKLNRHGVFFSIKIYSNSVQTVHWGIWKVRFNEGIHYIILMMDILWADDEFNWSPGDSPQDNFIISQWSVHWLSSNVKSERECNQEYH